MISFQAFRLDTANQCLWRGQDRVPIPPKPYDMLRYFVENPGRLITQDELLEKLWPEIYVNPELIRKYILDIRKVLGDRPDKPDRNRTGSPNGNDPFETGGLSSQTQSMETSAHTCPGGGCRRSDRPGVA